MIGTMYSSQSLPKAYGSAHAKKGGGSGLVTQVALVVLLVLSGGLSLMQLSARSQVRDLKIHHEALQEELTYTKNHLHHVESQLANKEAEYSHLAQEVHQHTGQPSSHELETLRTQKRTAEQSLSTAQGELKQLKDELNAAHALIDAYKQHLSDEVNNHHTREDTWMQVQQEWERLEQELSAEVNSLRSQLHAAHVHINEQAQHHAAHPQHVQPELPKRHDPLYDNLPPAHTPPQQQQQQYQHAAPTPTPAPVHTTTTTAPSPVPPHTQPAQQQQHTPQAQQQQQQQQHTVPSPTPAHSGTPPHPTESPHMHHDQHYPSHDPHHEVWKHTDYDQHWDAHNLYADYPGFVDEHQQQHDAHSTWQHHDDHGHHADQGHHAAAPQQHHDQHAQQQHAPQHGTAQHGGHHVPLPADTPAAQHTQQQQHGTAQHAGQHQQAHGQQHQQQQHHDPHATQHQDAHAQQHAQQQQHHVVDDLAMKLGLGGHYDDHQPEQPHHA